MTYRGLIETHLMAIEDESQKECEHPVHHDCCEINLLQFV